MAENERLGMSIKEFAVAAGISANLAYSLAKQNRLGVPVLRLGDKRLVLSRKAVLAFFGNGKEES